jgi:hypothetical protein
MKNKTMLAIVVLVIAIFLSYSFALFSDSARVSPTEQTSRGGGGTGGEAN